MTVLATVVDRPEPNLALLDAGSKTFSSDRSPDGAFGAWQDQRSVLLRRLSEEHGWATGPDVDALAVGERTRVVPAHICPVINLADEVAVIEQSGTDAVPRVVDTWPVAARGKVR